MSPKTFTAWVIDDPIRGVLKVLGKRGLGHSREHCDSLFYEDDAGVTHWAAKGDWFRDEQEARVELRARVQQKMNALRSEMMDLAGVLKRIESGSYPTVDLT